MTKIIFIYFHYNILKKEIRLLGLYPEFNIMNHLKILFMVFLIKKLKIRVFLMFLFEFSRLFKIINKKIV